MIVDASVVIAILRQEPGFEVYALMLERTDDLKMSPINFWEAAVIVDNQNDEVISSRFESLVASSHIDIVPVSVEHARIAREAHRIFGKGRGHKAKLNMGDCFAYALAKYEGEALLFKGNDFTHTDIVSAL